jgi:hypothetical protein
VPYYPVPQQPELQKIAHEEIQAVYAGHKRGAQVAESMYRRFEEVLKRG